MALPLALQRLHLARPFAVALQLLLQLRYRVGAFLVLLLEHRLDACQLLAIGVRRQLQVLVDIVVAGFLLLSNRFFGAGHFRVQPVQCLHAVGAMVAGPVRRIAGRRCRRVGRHGADHRCVAAGTADAAAVRIVAVGIDHSRRVAAKRMVVQFVGCLAG